MKSPSPAIRFPGKSPGLPAWVLREKATAIALRTLAASLLFTVAGMASAERETVLAAYEFSGPGTPGPTAFADGVTASEITFGGDFAGEGSFDAGALRIPSHLPPAPGSGGGKSYLENFVEFTLSAKGGKSILLDSITLDRRVSAAGPFGYTRVRTDRDGFAENIPLKPDVFGAKSSTAKGSFPPDAPPASSVTIRIYLLALKGNPDLGLILDNIRVTGEVMDGSGRAGEPSGPINHP